MVKRHFGAVVSVLRTSLVYLYQLLDVQAPESWSRYCLNLFATFSFVSDGKLGLGPRAQLNVKILVIQRWWLGGRAVV